MKFHIDFETQSIVNLKTAGIDVYSKHPTTEALCMAWCLDDGPVELWIKGDPFPIDLSLLSKISGQLAAHNAAFEFYIWNFVCAPKYGWPPLPVTSFDCTMIRGYAMGLPGHLANAAMAAGLDRQKDLVGQRIMLQICKPRNGPFENCSFCHGSGVYANQLCSCVEFYTPESAPEKYEILYEYCKQDIHVERDYDKRILPLSKVEKKLWELDQLINYRGVYVDRLAIETALQIVEVEKERLSLEIRKVTNNQVATCNAAISLKDWINTFDIYKGAVHSSDGPPSTLAGEKEEGILKWYKGDKKICRGVGKDVLADMLEMPDLPPIVTKAIKIRQEAAKSSTAKLKAMLLGMSTDGRVRGCLQFLGAASTGRWAGRRIQFQNMTRPSIGQDQIEEIAHQLRISTDSKKTLEWIDIFHGAPMTRIADCLRAMIIAPPGKKFISADFKSIEGIVLPWLAGDEKKLSIFKGHGRVYENTACGIFGITNLDDVTEYQRLIGKVAELACGFQGGVGAFQSMAKVYLVKIADSKAEQIKKAWRKQHPFIEKYWYDVEDTAINAVKYPGEKFSVGPVGRKVVFLQKGSFLFCRLPSGRPICYPYPKMQNVKTPWGAIKNALTYKGDEKGKFIRKVAYGGLIVENITQATARDLLAESMPRVESVGYPIVMHIHDELVSEVDKDFGSLEEMIRLMTIVPSWAKGMPIKASGWVGERFRK